MSVAAAHAPAFGLSSKVLSMASQTERPPSSVSCRQRKNLIAISGGPATGGSKRLFQPAKPIAHAADADALQGGASHIHDAEGDKQT
jgi:hypothetical protein